MAFFSRRVSVTFSCVRAAAERSGLGVCPVAAGPLPIGCGITHYCRCKLTCTVYTTVRTKFTHLICVIIGTLIHSYSYEWTTRTYEHLTIALLEYE